MAVKVTSARSMNQIGAKTYEQATSYKRDSQGYITILQGTKRVAEHAAGSWESVEVLDLLDARAGKKTTAKKKPAKVAAPRFGLLDTPTATKSAGDIRTSPHRAAGRAKTKRR